MDAPQHVDEPAPAPNSAHLALSRTGWLVLRQTPRNLTAVLRHAGVKGAAVRQLYSATPTDARIAAMFMLYKWRPDRGEQVRWNPAKMPPLFARAEDDSAAGAPEPLMFCNQIFNNASATQALILALMNISSDEMEASGAPISLGQALAPLKAFMAPMDPILRTAAVCSSSAVRDAHNAAAVAQDGGHPSLKELDGTLSDTALADELWMFTVFAHSGGWVYEMEGMSDGPKVIGRSDPTEGELWTDVCVDPIEKRIAELREHKTEFSLFALVRENEEANRDGGDVEKNSEELAAGPQSPHSDSPDVRGNMDDPRVDGSRNGDGNSVATYDRDSVDVEQRDSMPAEEIERIQSTHKYDTFLIEMMKLMASRGDINALIQGDNDVEDAIEGTASDE